MAMRDHLNEAVYSLRRSAIREFSAMAAARKDCVRLTLGEPDFATPEPICKAALESVFSGDTHYIENNGSRELLGRVAQFEKNKNGLDYEADEIILTAGATEALFVSLLGILNPGDEVIIPIPAFVLYEEIVRLARGVPVHMDTSSDGFQIKGDKLESLITDRTKAVILNSPNNPTGMIYDRDDLQVIADFAVEHDFYVVSDEMYENLCYGKEEPVSIASLNDEIYKRTITVNGLAKSYAMTGWRIGYAGAPLEIAKVMGSVQSHQTSNPNSIAQMAALAAISGDQTCVRVMNAAFDERRKYTYDRVCDIEGLSAIEPKGAFYVFVDASELIGKKYKGQEITGAADIGKFLIEDYYVAIIPCDDFGFSDHFRLSYAISVSEIDKGMDRIKEFCESLTE